MAHSDWHGLLVLDKPLGETSRAAVDRAQRWFPRGTRVGHTGTLDPLATGVLVLCVGHATRLTEYVQAMGKTYVTDVTLGARSATDDAEGPIMPVSGVQPPESQAVEAAVGGFVGSISQVPPAFSAAKVTGRRAYDLARQGSAVDLAPRTVRIDSIDILDYAYPILRLEVRCGKGTYIRSLARDLGERLGCGGFVSTLRRTRVGSFTPEEAVPWDADAATAHARLRPVGETVGDLPRVTADAAAVAHLGHGRGVAWSTLTAGPAPVGDVAVFETSGALVALGRVERDYLRPAKVFIG